MQTYRLGQAEPGAGFVLWTILPILVCGLPLRLSNRPCVFLLTGLGSIFDATNWRRRILKGAVTKAYKYLFSGSRSRVIVHNQEDKIFLTRDLGIPHDRVTVTPGCGVDPLEYPRLPARPPSVRKIVLVPVRLLREKGVLEAAEASRILRTWGVDHEMWFSCSIDPGNPSSLTSAEVDEMQRGNPTVRVVGYHTSTVPLYRACDIVLIPTRYREGLPTALLEAAACGRPIVTTDNVGCREFAEDETTALVVATGTAAELAVALRRLIEDETLGPRLAERAYEKFLTGFTKEVMVERTLRVLRDLGLRPSGLPALQRADA